MLKLSVLLGGWIAVNAVVAAALLNRRPIPHLRERWFRWVLDDPKTSPLREELKYGGQSR
jgi:hypothetical protein